jgi:hypothetical protein
MITNFMAKGSDFTDYTIIEMIRKKTEIISSPNLVIVLNLSKCQCIGIFCFNIMAENDGAGSRVFKEFGERLEGVR